MPYYSVTVSDEQGQEFDSFTVDAEHIEDACIKANNRVSRKAFLV